MIKNDEERTKIMLYLFNLYPRLAKFWLGPIPCIAVTHPELIQKVLTSEDCLEKNQYLYKLSQLDESLIVEKYPKWKTHRRIFNYSFKSKMLQNYIPTMIECCDRLAIKLQEHADNSEFNIYESISNETLEMILANMYGEEPNSIGNRNYKDLIEAVEFIQKSWFYRMGSLSLHPDFIYKRSNLGKKENAARRKIFHEMQEIFKTKLNQPKKSLKNNNEEFTIIDQIINNFDTFDDDEKIQNIVMFLIAGYETTAKTVSSTLLLLAMNPDIQEKVFDEINGVFFADDIEFDVENLNKLQYTTQVLNESMRLLTTTPVIMRTTLNNILLDDHMIPNQTDILMNFYALHRRKDIWGENAEKFDPENFAPEKVATRHPYSFLPFSAGKRNCIGYRYAYISMKIMLVKILKLYKISTRVKYEDLRIASDILLRYSPGPIVKLSRRRM